MANLVTGDYGDLISFFKNKMRNNLHLVKSFNYKHAKECNPCHEGNMVNVGVETSFQDPPLFSKVPNFLLLPDLYP